MSQILVAQSFQGIILAAENRAIQLNEKGEEVPFFVNRLIPFLPIVPLSLLERRKVLI